MDSVNEDGGSIFYRLSSYHRWDGEKSRYAIQFNKEGNCQKCIGNKGKDGFDMIVTGIRDVNWGDKGQC